MNPYLLGLDVSKWQSSVNWAYAKTQGVQYAFIKAQEWYFTDAQFYNHWSASSAAGVPRGAYLYYRDALVPEPQAQKFHDLLTSTGDVGELPPALDIEEKNNPTLTPSKIKACLETLASLFGRAPVFYSRNDIVNTLGNPAWLLPYPLWLAQYTLIGWQESHFEKVKQYPPTIPSPYPFYSVWQFSDKCPSVNFQVTGSSTVDTNYMPDTILSAWTGQPPPPDPEPIGDEPIMKFKALKTYNIRSGPGTNYPDIGDLTIGTVITALQIQTISASSVWVEFELSKWVAMVHAGVEYLDYFPAPPPAPVPMMLRQATVKTNLTWYKELNAAGKPLMTFPPSGLRPQFEAGAVIACDPVKIDADGTIDYYRVLNGEHATPKTYLPTGGETGWFVSAAETFEI